MLYATADEARNYLKRHNGWTDEECDAFFAKVGTHSRTTDQWTELAANF